MCFSTMFSCKTRIEIIYTFSWIVLSLIVQVLEPHNLVRILEENLYFSCKTGYYRFCCEGVYCPECPLELNISTLGQNVTVNSALNLSCVNTSFTATFSTNRQPDNFTIKVSGQRIDNFRFNYLFHKRVSYIVQYDISHFVTNMNTCKILLTILTNTLWFFFSQVRYSFVNNSEHIVSERVLGRIHLQGEFYIFFFPAIFIETGQNVISFLFCFFCCHQLWW